MAETQQWNNNNDAMAFLKARMRFRRSRKTRLAKKTKPEEAGGSDTTEATIAVDDLLAASERQPTAVATRSCPPSVTATSTSPSVVTTTSTSSSQSSSKVVVTSSSRNFKMHGKIKIFSGHSERKARKKQLAEDLLEESFREADAVRKAQAPDPEEVNQRVVLWYLQLRAHYFWGSQPLLQLYAVAIATVVLGRFWVLHGIYLVILGHMLANTIKWGHHVMASKEFSDGCALISSAMHRSKDEMDRVVHGDSLRIWLAGASTLAWTKVGKSVIYQMLREQYQGINETVVKENKAKLERNSKMQKQLYVQFIKQNFTDSVQKRASELKRFGVDVKQRGMASLDAVKEAGSELKRSMEEKKIELRYNIEAVQGQVHDRMRRLSTVASKDMKQPAG